VVNGSGGCMKLTIVCRGSVGGLEASSLKNLGTGGRGGGCG
jgi:hypothetical protein